MLLTILLCAALVGIDQVLKYLAVQYLAPVGAAPFIPGFIEFRYTENTGAAFNLLSGHQGILIAITGVALLFGLFILLFRRPKNKLEYISILMIVAGGIGNLVDRIANGFVVDYLRFLFVEFAIFNFADCLVVIGFILLVIAIFRAESRAKKKREAEEAAAEGQGDEDAAITAEPASPSPRAQESKTGSEASSASAQDATPLAGPKGQAEATGTALVADDADAKD